MMVNFVQFKFKIRSKWKSSDTGNFFDFSWNLIEERC